MAGNLSACGHLVEGKGEAKNGMAEDIWKSQKGLMTGDFWSRFQVT